MPSVRARTSRTQRCNWAGVAHPVELQAPHAMTENVSGGQQNRRMDITTFPPFTMTVAAVDELTRCGTLRVTFDPSRRSFLFREAAAMPGDEVYHCPGAEIAVPTTVARHLTGATLDYDAAGFVMRLSGRTEQTHPTARQLRRVA